ncbi:hypothetical protein GCM10023063_25060 [Arthrobacter methylotrophus]|uniref:Ig-like domain-containing protein n=1 Tax=Arthrobacter methylotrophus TaxID=121291 RepID=A0ABV5URB7_9MICC
MSSIVRRRVKWFVAPLLAVASIAVASPAFADPFKGRNVSTVVNVSPGSTAALNWTYKNTGPDDYVPSGHASITFNAPTGTTFPAQSTVPVTSSMDGSNFVASTLTLTGCVLGGGGTTLACTLGTTDGKVMTWKTDQLIRFSPQVAVSPTATPGTQSAAAAMTYADSIDDGTLDVNIVQTAAVPMIDPLVGLGAGALLLGTVAAGVLNRRRGACLVH